MFRYDDQLPMVRCVSGTNPQECLLAVTLQSHGSGQTVSTTPSSNLVNQMNLPFSTSKVSVDKLRYSESNCKRNLHFFSRDIPSQQLERKGDILPNTPL
jgi:hypothetical protein